MEECQAPFYLQSNEYFDRFNILVFQDKNRCLKITVK